MNRRRQLVLAHGICEFDSTLDGLTALHRASRRVAEPDTRAPVAVPFTVLSTIRTELRILLDRWDAEFPGAITEAVSINQTDLGSRAALVRAWLTVNIEELDSLLRDLERG